MRWLLPIVVLCLFVAAPRADAHAIIMESKPAKNAVVIGKDTSVELRFNSRVDLKRSVITLIGPGDQRSDVKVSDQSQTDRLVASLTGLTSGEYRLRWQVLSVDGHITRGDIPFTDKAE